MVESSSTPPPEPHSGMINKKALLAAEKAYRDHIEGRAMHHALEAYEAAIKTMGESSTSNPEEGAVKPLCSSPTKHDSYMGSDC